MAKDTKFQEALSNGTPADPIDSFVKLANTYPKQAIMLMFWMARHQNPDFSIEIKPHDLEGFNQCMDYLDVTPEIKIFRPPGMPAQEPIPATGNRRGVPGHAERPPKDLIVVQMVDGDGNAIVPIENNEQDQELGRRAKAMARAKQMGGQLAGLLSQQASTGEFSAATCREAAEALALLSKA